MGGISSVVNKINQENSDIIPENDKNKQNKQPLNQDKSPSKQNNNISKCYKFHCPVKNVLNNSIFELKYSFSNIIIKSCLSHSKNGNSLYVTAISLGDKKYQLITNYGNEPLINGLFEFHKQLTVNELENLYFKVIIYEFTELQEYQQDLFKTQNGYQILSQMKSKCNYYSYFEMDLLSFLFRPFVCDFAMFGHKPLSTCARIFFLCHIDHRSSIVIKANVI